MQQNKYLSFFLGIPSVNSEFKWVTVVEQKHTKSCVKKYRKQIIEYDTINETYEFT